MSSWREHLDELGLPIADDPGGRVIVVSAHPDDEVLAVGAWLAGQVDREIVFVTATDGEGSHPGSPTTTPDDLRRVRPDELLAALAALGHETPDVRRLRLADSGLSREREQLARALTPLLVGAALVLAPSVDDGHADHDVVGAVVDEVATSGAVVWHYAVWRWERTTPDGTPVTWTANLARLPEPSDGRDRKKTAIAAFATQIGSLSDDPADAQVVPESLLDHARTALEVVTT